MRQNSITVITPILQDKAADLKFQLSGIYRDINEGRQKELAELNTIHFARWVIIDDRPDTTPKLVLIVDFDGSKSDLWEGLCSDHKTLFDRIYEHCEGYPSHHHRTPESRKAYFSQYIVKDTAVYVGAPKRTLPQILKERDLRNFIRNFVDSKSWKGIPAQKIHDEIREAVFAQSGFEWVKEPVELPSINWLGMSLLVLLLLLFLPLILVWILFVHFFYERKDINFTLKRSDLEITELNTFEKSEDFKHQNQFSQLVSMKPSKVRLITIQALFIFANALIKFFFVEGKLMGIPTIHFARWVMFDDNKRILFFSNFDGSWQQYLSDFIDKSGWGLTGIFSNTAVFPKTNFLLTGGAYDEEHFLAWSRNSEVKTNVWYSAYPDLSIKNVNNNSLIRSQLMGPLSERDAVKFLKLI